MWAKKIFKLRGVEMSSLFSWTDRVAIVTGAGKGIGKALALVLAQAGADVVVAARTAADIEKTAEEIRALGRRAVPVPTDVQQSEQVANMVKRALEEFQRVDILVNNVGGGPKRPVLQQSERFWDAILRLNLTTTFLCSKAVAEAMIKQGKGSIINIASTIGRGNMPCFSAYAVSKDGVISLTQRLALEWAPYHIRVNAIAPGFVATEMAAEYFRQDPDLREELKRVPLGRAAKPEDIVGAAIYLASDASDYVTGSTITIDGGLTRSG
jgi:NAD(P)-dependent dehydrogenase (short-subunit alcohol dehydrogenase family)